MFANKGLKLKKRPASESSEDTNINRIISFGSMPSYRWDRLIAFDLISIRAVIEFEFIDVSIYQFCFDI